MSWWRDIFRQCVFMSFFIIPIPIGSYTIHSGSSAAVALISHLALSFLIPLAYVGTKEATFGPKQARISRISFVIAWLVLAAVGGAFSAFMGQIWKTSSFWEWPTIGRDIVFIGIMYGELCATMLGAYTLSRFHDTCRKESV